MIKLEFPFRLISKDNEKLRSKSGIVFLSKRFKDFEKEIRLFANAQYKGDLIFGPVKVTIEAYFSNKVHSDAGNLSKSCLDALQGIVYSNDRQIKELTVKVFEGKDNKEGFVITTEEIVGSPNCSESLGE